jgi:hypothetical protein
MASCILQFSTVLPAWWTGNNGIEVLNVKVGTKKARVRLFSRSLKKAMVDTPYVSPTVLMNKIF